MADGHKTPSELVDYMITVGIDKATKPLFKLMLLGIFGGAFIALGGAGNIISASTLAKTDPGLAKFVGACVFPVGLIMVVILGSELFTSNCLLSVAYTNKKINFTQLIRNLVTVYLFNYVGSFIVAYITVRGGSFNADSLDYLQNIATHKVHADAYALFIKGILYTEFLLFFTTIRLFLPVFFIKFSGRKHFRKMTLSKTVSLKHASTKLHSSNVMLVK